MQRITEKCREIETFRGMQRNVENCRKFIQMQSSADKCREIQRNAERCRGMQKNAELADRSGGLKEKRQTKRTYRRRESGRTD